MLRHHLCYVTDMLKKTQCPRCREQTYSLTAGCPCESDVTYVESDVTMGPRVIKSDVTGISDVTIAPNGDVTPVSNVTGHCRTCTCDTKAKSGSVRQREYRERRRNE